MFMKFSGGLFYLFGLVYAKQCPAIKLLGAAVFQAALFCRKVFDHQMLSLGRYVGEY